MTTALVSAGALLILLAAAHSVIGELLIFRHLRTGSTVRDEALALLPMRRWLSIWSTWHLVSLLGAGIGCMLWAAAFASRDDQTNEWMLWVITGTIGVAGLFWLVGTRGRHPAWIVLGGVFLLLLSGLTTG